MDGPSQTVELMLPPGVSGRYAALRKVGDGGMGEAWLAEDRLLTRQVVLKRVHPGGKTGQDAARLRGQLLSEAKRACSIKSPYVAQVYDVLEGEDELLLVIEFIEGGSLRPVVGKPMPLKRFVKLALQLAEALQAIHAAGVLHCDIKPENILLDRDETVKVVDFGLARVPTCGDYTGETLSLEDLANTVCGTPGYIPPEVLKQEGSSERSDVFSLGTVFYELLTGSNPFVADTIAETIDRTFHLELRAPSSVVAGLPVAVDGIVMGMVEKEPQKRTASAGVVLGELEVLRDGVAQAGTGGRLWRWTGAPERMALAGVVLLMALVGGWYGMHRVGPGPVDPNGPRKTVPERTQVLAVLPFEVIGGDKSLEALAEGLRTTITGRLAHLTGHGRVEVLSAGELKGRQITTAAQARQAYGVDLVVEGSLHEYGSTVRIEYGIVDAKTGHKISSETVTSSLDEPFALEDRVVSGVSGMVGDTGGSSPAVGGSRLTNNGEAYDAYLRGLGYMREFDDAANNDRALNSFKKAVALDSGFVEARAELGVAYWNAYVESKDRSAIETAHLTCDAALAMKPDNPAPKVCLATIATGTGHPERAVVLLEEALKADSRDDVAMKGLARAYEKLGKTADAERVYRQAIGERSQYWANYYYLANFYVRQAKYRDAATVFRSALQISPDNATLHRSFGVTQFLLGDFDGALASLEHALMLRPTAQVYSDLGEVYVHKQQYDKASESFENALRIKPGSMATVADLADAEYWNPNPQLRAKAFKDYVEAAGLAKDALQVNAQNVDALQVLAYTEAALGHKAASRRSIDAALTHSPEDAEVLMYAARTCQRNGDSAGAMAWLQKAIARGYSKEDIRTTPDFLKLRGSPQFESLLH